MSCGAKKIKIILDEYPDILIYDKEKALNVITNLPGFSNKSAEMKVIMANTGPNKTKTKVNNLFILLFWTIDKKNIKKDVIKLCFTIKKSKMKLL